jgi:hypothetical protein
MSHPSRTRPISHQTVRIAAGRHAMPDEGASVMELASMLAGERFSDHPRSACPVIAAFLRAYNDAVDDARRQDLYVCAADAVGTRDSRATRRARLARCERELDALRPARAPRTWQDRAARRVERTLPGGRTALVADLADALSRAEGGHPRALRLVRELVETHVSPPPPCRVMSGLRVPDVGNEPGSRA